MAITEEVKCIVCQCESTICLSGGPDGDENANKFSFCSECFEEMKMGYEYSQRSNDHGNT